jgi:hypothetical protein
MSKLLFVQADLRRLAALVMTVSPSRRTVRQRETERERERERERELFPDAILKGHHVQYSSGGVAQGEAISGRKGTTLAG